MRNVEEEPSVSEIVGFNGDSSAEQEFQVPVLAVYPSVEYAFLELALRSDVGVRIVQKSQFAY